MDWIKVGKTSLTNARNKLVKLLVTKALDNKDNIQTNADILSHKIIVQTLKISGYSCNLYSEEENEVVKINGGDDNVKIVIDPIDYTHFFLRNELSFCSVGMLIIIKNKPTYAFIASLENNDLYHCDEKFAYKNNRKITVPKRIQGRNIILSYAPAKSRFKKFAKHLLTLTNGNYLAYNFMGLLPTAKIADGKYDATIEIEPTPLHEFAGALIVKRAGGIISTLEGEEIDWNPKKKQTLLVARNKKIHQDILKQFYEKI
jgi:fructose-1,6-bisphosphatase/inositol monophosphatase family enzyme